MTDTSRPQFIIGRNRGKNSRRKWKTRAIEKCFFTDTLAVSTVDLSPPASADNRDNLPQTQSQVSLI